MKSLTIKLLLYFILALNKKIKQTEALSDEFENLIEINKNNSLLVKLAEGYFVGHRTVRAIGVSQFICDNWPSNIPIEVFDEIG